MTKQEFIDKIAPLVQKYAPSYGIKAVSAVIGQACNESNFGASKLSAVYHNYFGMKCGSKWTGRSVNLNTKEEYSAGTLTNISANFRVYSSMEEGVKGYFEFIQLERYQNLRGITDPEKYLYTIKTDGYATSTTYVTNIMAVIKQYNLTKYDKEVKEVAEYLAESGHDEYYRYTGGKAGDQTGNEACVGSYRSGWSYYLEPKDAAFGDKIANAAIDYCNNDKIGYDQNQRNSVISEWKKAGKISKIKTACEGDCSAMVSLCVSEAGADVVSGRSNAPYTGNIREILMGTGKFKLVSSPTKRGTVLLIEGQHTAIYIGTSKTKTSEKQTAEKPVKEEPIVFTYRVKSGGKWSNEVKNLNGYAGTIGKKITDVAIKVNKGNIWYQVHTVGGKWIEKVTGYNIKDYENGYAGIGKPIDCIRVFYSTPSGYSVKYATYRVSPVNKNYYPYQKDDIVSLTMDGYAGDYGRTIDRFQIYPS